MLLDSCITRIFYKQRREVGTCNNKINYSMTNFSEKKTKKDK